MSPFRLLFVCKKRSTYWGDSYASEISTGLGNSVRYLVDMLNASGVPAAAAEVADNNGIQAQIVKFNPTHVIVEALWVVPSKFTILRSLYPRIQWAVRLHSNLPFLSHEGMALDWIAGYLAQPIEIMCNSTLLQADLRQVADDFGRPEALITYGPNYYPPSSSFSPAPAQLHIGCFGAIRPLKNQLAQAVAAIAFSNQVNRRLYFHINGGRLEGAAGPILRNIRALFAGSVGIPHVLIEESWLPHDRFLALLATMSLAMQVSFTETFNLVAADGVSVGVPTVVSPAISWLGAYAQADPANTRSITAALISANVQNRPSRAADQVRDLTTWALMSMAIWLGRFA